MTSDAQTRTNNSPFDPTLQNSDGLVFFPVRHSSPASARMLLQLARQLKPSAILIEGPANFNPHLPELLLDHQLPIAIYSFARFEDDSRTSAFYPLAEYCPEWQAIQVAHELQTHVEFIDLPWEQMTRLTEETNRYSDRHFIENPWPALVAQKLNVQTFDEVWDVLFELDPDLTPHTYLERCARFCTHLRDFSGPETLENHAREAFMIEQIRRVRTQVSGPILIVTGGFHSPGLHALWHGWLPEAPTPDISHPPLQSGITLTPFTYPRLDQLNGYPSGVQGPGFYEYVWRQRQANRPIDSFEILWNIADTLRQKNQLLSTADLIAAHQFAQAMAHLHGRREIWRFDLLDAIESTLVKEHSPDKNPIVIAARKQLTGTRRGILSTQARLPALFQHTLETLTNLELLPDTPRTLQLDLTQTVDLTRSHTLHRCQCLALAGIRKTGGTDFLSRNDTSELWETWHLEWQPEFDASLIENAIYGADLAEAAAARLIEQTEPPHKAHELAALVVQATLMNLGPVANSLIHHVQHAILATSNPLELAAGLDHLTFLHRHYELFQTPLDIFDLLTQTWLKTLHLLDTLGSTDRHQEVIQAFHIVHTIQRQWLHQDDFTDVFHHLHAIATAPLIRGLSAGVLFAEDAMDTPDIMRTFHGFLDPMDLADFLIGLFAIAREEVQRDPRTFYALDHIIDQADETIFLEMLPGLRLAFTFFTPLEHHRIIDLLFQTSHSIDHTHLEAALVALMQSYGIPQPARHLSLVPQTPAHQPLPMTHSRMERWRLILGHDTPQLPSLCGGAARRDQLLDFLYSRENAPHRNIRSSRQAGLGPSSLDVPDWINGIHQLFPKRTIERLEKDALDRYHIEEIATRAEVLARATPNMTLLKAVLRTRHLMNQDVLNMARKLIQQVIDELIQKLSREIQTPFTGALNRRRRSNLKIAKNFDPDQTIRTNLKHYNPDTQNIIVHKAIFYSRIQRQVDQWRIITLVDQSGSMLDSVIHAAVTASIFHGMRTFKSSLIAFDTDIVDLTDNIQDPVETLLQVQLGGGTDIANAMQYAQKIVDDPRRTILVLITDFFEGPPPEHLINITRHLVEDGVQVLGLAALDSDANPYYDRDIAARLVQVGAHVAAMTPGELAQWIAEKIR